VAVPIAAPRERAGDKTISSNGPVLAQALFAATINRFLKIGPDRMPLTDRRAKLSQNMD
jgi:hypothetical protein